ncbi:tetratricopeptide repeat protein [Flammeovirga kamogawensis]|uniref:Tetratricopeptide repeat protein n=1 Tax=Flammeovirga kamogawensis TaxID=373891 RepID=A0ABX8GSI5_9BACT|nr:tetratricopeptide repeat protein [Flammeovirga kamogawensis]MBB6463995.1 TolA-binding protein [Flammeovirga kamogawensis]QWG06127.1 tetratricopeptide repeat protein [Flammeovirga kamogawensis]TRX67959.1 tetratricopeptide repeat protein [Flammeovirga kamogawensis]
MGTKQYSLIGIGIVLIIVLALLPKAVVTDNSANAVENNESTAQTEQHSDDDGHDHGSNKVDMASAHSEKLPADTQSKLDSLQDSFESGKGTQNKITVANEAYDLLIRMNKFDRAAEWKLALYGVTDKSEDLKSAADAYYDAFTFAMSEEKSSKMASLARSNYNQYLKLEPKDLNSKVKLGMTYVVSSSPMQGITLIREVIAEEPNHQLAIFNLGLLSMQSGQYDKAVGRFEQLKKLYPEDMEARFYLALALKEVGKKNQAIKELEFINKNADSEDIRVTSSQYLAEWVN